MSAAEERSAKSLAEISHANRQMVRIFEAVNTNLLEIAKLIKNHLETPVDLDELEKNIKRFKQIKAENPIEKIQDANELEIPALIDDSKIGPNEYVPDDQGRMKPYEWRHNLGWDKFDEDPWNLENTQMTRNDFLDYNHRLNNRARDEDPAKRIPEQKDESGWKGDF